MKAYAHYSFLQSPLSKGSYILKNYEGDVEGLEFLKYADTPQNEKLGSSGLEYMRCEVPRNPSIRKYFAHVFTVKNGPLTSVEPVNSWNRTFGDAKKIGLNDLILFQFSDDNTSLEMWFVKDMGNFKEQKQNAFKKWCEGEDLSM